MSTFRSIVACALVTVASLATSPVVHAEAPEAFVQRSANDLMSVLKTYQANGVDDLQVLKLELEKSLDRYIDYDRIAQTIMGVKHSEASSAQKSRVVLALRDSLLSTYTAAISATDLSDIEIEVGKGMTRSGRRNGQLTHASLVPVTLISPTSSSTLEYGLRSKDKENWKVSLMRFNGIDVSKAYRAQFSAFIQDHATLEEAIEAWISALEATSMQDNSDS